MDRAVEVTHEAVGITLLFDTFSGESKNLLESFKNAGAAFHAAVIEDDGFLPDDLMRAYRVSRCISIRYRFLITGA